MYQASYRETGCSENKLDTGEDKNVREREGARLEQTVKVRLRPNSNPSEAGRSRLNQSAGRSLSQDSRADRPARAQKELEGELTELTLACVRWYRA